MILARLNKNIKTHIKKIINLFIEAIFPSRCSACGKLGSFWCSSCQEKITFISSQVCLYCQKIEKRGRHCSRHRRNRFLSGVIACFYYDEKAIKKIVYDFKYRGLAALAPVLAEKMISALEKEKLRFDLVSFVPASRKRYLWRGYNQAEELAKEISQKAKTEMAPPLIKICHTKPQVGLGKKERILNLKDKIQFRGDSEVIKNKTILLVDDVCTTGSTLEECAKAYKKAGAKSIWGLVFTKE